MKNKGKFVALLLALVMVFTLCACGEKVVEVDDNEYIYIGYDVDEIAFPDPADPMDPAEVYKDLDYTPAMLGGYYCIENDSKEQFQQDYSYIMRDVFSEYSECMESLYLSSVPYRISAGVSSLESSLESIYADRTHDWAFLYFYTEDGSSKEVLCSVTVNGNTVSYTPVNYYVEARDDDYNVTGITYEIGDKSIDYTFERGATSITLTSVDNGESITFESFYKADYPNTVKLKGVAAEGSPTIEEISQFEVYRDLGDDEYFGYASYTSEATYDRIDEYASMTRSGLFTVYYVMTANGGHKTEFSQSFVYLDTYNSCVLIDENGTVYYYTETNDTLEGEDVEITEIDDAARMIMEQHRSEILDKLVEEMQAGGIDINVNYETGEVSLDAGILFDVNSYDISDEGKATLDKFIEIYTGVVFSDEFSDWVSRIVVEGHTDTNGDYDSNMTLSENRANSVLDYCLSCPSCSDYAAQMKDTMSAVGMSYDRPVYNDDGSVNMDASRRVSFRIVISLADIEV